jgi:hypothetical protein
VWPQGEKAEIFFGVRGLPPLPSRRSYFLVVYRQYDKGPEPIAVTEASAE